jgi:hypothetical protein
MVTTNASPTVDAHGLAEALSTLGLLYGAREGLAHAAKDATDDAYVIRAFIRKERPHLLESYDLDALVSLVLAAKSRKASAPLSIEQFKPA